MKMKIEIFENNEKINEILETDEKKIYKKIAQIYKAKEDKTTTRTIIKSCWGCIVGAVEIFGANRTLTQDNYKYKYTFEDVEI